jgi:uncharacterized membrane protein YhaH (DUF805 family)
MNFSTAFKKYSIDNIFDFTGRASRWEYFGGFSFAYVLTFVGLFITSFVSEALFDIAYPLLGIWLFIANISCTWRRLHDVGKSGWNYLWALTGIGGFYLLFLYVQPSVQEDNEWGPPPPHTIVI